MSMQSLSEHRVNGYLRFVQNDRRRKLFPANDRARIFCARERAFGRALARFCLGNWQRKKISQETGRVSRGNCALARDSEPLTCTLTSDIFSRGDFLTDQISYHAKRGEHAERHFVPVVSVSHVKIEHRHFAWKKDSSLISLSVVRLRRLVLSSLHAYRSLRRIKSEVSIDFIIT